MLFPIFLPNWKNLCLYPPQNLSYSCVRRNDDKESGVGRESDSPHLQRERSESFAAYANPEGSVGVFVCLFGELSEGTRRS